MTLHYDLRPEFFRYHCLYFRSLLFFHRRSLFLRTIRRKITIFLRQILSKLFYEQSILFITDPRVGIILNREPIPVQELNHRVDSHVQFSLYLN